MMELSKLKNLLDSRENTKLLLIEGIGLVRIPDVTPSQEQYDKVSHDCHIECDKVSHEN